MTPEDQSKNGGDSRAFTHGSGGAAADAAVEGRPNLEDRHAEVPHARPAEPLAEHTKHDQLAEKAAEAADRDEHRQEALLDEGIEESFPASDPVSPKHIT